MCMVNIKEKLSVAEYEFFKKIEDVYKVKDSHHFDFLMGFKKCRIIVNQDFNISFKDMSILDGEMSFHKCTDMLTLDIMNHRLHQLLNEEEV